RISWQQFTVGSGYQLWNIDSEQESAEFIVEKKDGNVVGEDLAVLVSVNADVEPALATTRSDLPLFRGFVHIRHPKEASYLIKNAGQAAHIAKLVADEIRNARTEFHLRGRIHLFMAVPAGLAMMVGQLLNTLGPIQTYEHIPTDPTGRYHPAALLVPK
ncbi:MAG: SAVED domain-containing protein, partial [Deltaproteobacteria bacterium]|nr:SAVED domain-containing protein [Deltaproteobacteria bacterium]